MVEDLFARGWARWPVDEAVLHWLEHAVPVATARIADPEERALWLQCQGTWFVGVDTLPNDERGAVGGSGPLAGEAYAAARAIYGDLPLHRAQISVIYPDYPKPRVGETDAAFRYRRDRDAAHVDGLLAVGEAKQRMLKEQHAYILGLPMTMCSGAASPFVVWEGSHEVMRAAFLGALTDLPAETWPDVDLTAVYQDARRRVFETCPRVELPAVPGEAYLVHRLALHGVAPWGQGAVAPPEGRVIAYLRPELPMGSRGWLDLP